MVIELVLFDGGLVIELVVELLVAAFYIPGGIRALMAFSDGAFQLVTLAESVALLGGIGVLFGRRYDAWFAAPALVGMSGGFEDAEPEEAVPAPSTGGGVLNASAPWRMGSWLFMARSGALHKKCAL